MFGFFPFVFFVPLEGSLFVVVVFVIIVVVVDESNCVE